MSRRLLLVLVVGLAALAALLCAGTAADAAAVPSGTRPVLPAGHTLPVRVVSDCEHARYEPSQLVVSCADDGVFFKDLTYRTWTRHQATGRGQLWVNTCTPTCVAGHYVHHAVRVVVDRAVRVDHELRYSRIIAVYVHPRRHHYRQVYFLPVRAQR